MFQKFEIGTIYVYRNEYRNKRNFLLKAIGAHTRLPIEITINDRLVNVETLERLKRSSASSGARFGSSLLNLGQFDGDKYQDFAVGAPYEDGGTGAVYIYRGSKNFWSTDGVHGTPNKYNRIKMCREKHYFSIHSLNIVLVGV